MAKGSNPADAHRKAMKAKENKKNKEARKGAREVAIVKTDTRSLENEIKVLNSKAQRAPLSTSDKAELEAAKLELAKITKAKTEYVEAHPESRKVVFPERAPQNVEGSSNQVDNGYGLYLKDGKLRHPELSYYYDSVFNPFGAPPPGMPYRRRDPTPEERTAMLQAQMARFVPPPAPPSLIPVVKEESSSDEDDDDEDDDEDDIALPEGPAPTRNNNNNSSDSDSDSDDDEEDEDGIVMPVGPPPPKPGTINLPPTSNNSRITIARPSSLPFPPQHHPHLHYQQHQQQQNQFHPQPFHPDPHLRFGPPPPPGMGPRNPNFIHPGNNNNANNTSRYPLPNRPIESQSQTLDPLNLPELGGGVGSGIPNTYQAYQAARLAASSTSTSTSSIPSIPIQSTSKSGLPTLLPPHLSTSTSINTTTAALAKGVIISAAPQLRDLKAEATAFLPSHMRKKQKLSSFASSSSSSPSSSGAGGKKSEAISGLGRINAAPISEVGEGGGGGGEERASLMGALRGVGIAPVLSTTIKSGGGQGQGQGKEDYERFKREMEDFL